MSASQRNPADSGAKKPAIAGKSEDPEIQGGAQLGQEERFECEGFLSALEAGLAEAVPGIEILDRNLVFDSRVRADLAVVDSEGRLQLVLVARDDPQQALLETLDALAYLRGNAGLLMRHLGSRQVDQRLQPRVILVDSSNDELLAERLAPLEMAGVSVFGVRTLRTSGSERSYLVPLTGEAIGCEADPQIAVLAFLNALPLPMHALAADLVRRMTGLDEHLSAAPDENSLVWRRKGKLVARLECRADVLRASIAPDHHFLIISVPEDVDALLELALLSLMADYERDDGETHGLPGGLGSLAAAVGEALLSEDEIRAFHG